MQASNSASLASGNSSYSGSWYESLSGAVAGSDSSGSSSGGAADMDGLHNAELPCNGSCVPDEVYCSTTSAAIARSGSWFNSALMQIQWTNSWMPLQVLQDESDLVPTSAAHGINVLCWLQLPTLQFESDESISDWIEAAVDRVRISGLDTWSSPSAVATASLVSLAALSRIFTLFVFRNLIDRCTRAKSISKRQYKFELHFKNLSEDLRQVLMMRRERNGTSTYFSLQLPTLHGG